MKAYKNHFPAAEPEDEFDDRNRLYSIKVAINYSAMERGNTGRVRRRTCVCSSQKAEFERNMCSHE